MNTTAPVDLLRCIREKVVALQDPATPWTEERCIAAMAEIRQRFPAHDAAASMLFIFQGASIAMIDAAIAQASKEAP